MTRYFTGCIDGAIAMSQSVLNDLVQFRSDIPVKLSPHPVFDNFGASVPRQEALIKLDLNRISDTFFSSDSFVHIKVWIF